MIPCKANTCSDESLKRLAGQLINLVIHYFFLCVYEILAEIYKLPNFHRCGREVKLFNSFSKPQQLMLAVVNHYFYTILRSIIQQQFD